MLNGSCMKESILFHSLLRMYICTSPSPPTCVIDNFMQQASKKFPFTVRTTETGNPVPFPFNFCAISVQSPYVFNLFYGYPVRSINLASVAGRVLRMSIFLSVDGEWQRFYYE